jgi:DNA (cytosine-5)-methyltransferase 1
VVRPAVNFLKPRIVSIKNTSRLQNITKNLIYFKDLIKSIINGRWEKDKENMRQEYNVRYKIVNMADYGLPQERKRLPIIRAK